MLLETFENLVLLRARAMVCNETKECTEALTPVRLDQVVLGRVVELLGHECKGAVSGGLSVCDVLGGMLQVVPNVARGQDVEREMLIPILDDLERVTREGGYRGQEMTVLVDVCREDEGVNLLDPVAISWRGRTCPSGRSTSVRARVWQREPETGQLNGEGGISCDATAGH